MSAEWLDRLALRLLAHAERAMPSTQAAWAHAMRRELEHVPRRERVAWAIGCLAASYFERNRLMSHRIAGLSPWVLGLELAVCFVWPTLLFSALVSGGAWGLSGPLPLDAWLASMLVATVLGPLGLALAFKVIVLRRSTLGALPVLVLAASSAWAFVAFTAQAIDGDWSRAAINGWVLLALLPAIGAAHLIYAARASRNPRVA